MARPLRVRHFYDRGQNSRETPHEPPTHVHHQRAFNATSTSSFPVHNNQHARRSISLHTNTHHGRPFAQTLRHELRPMHLRHAYSARTHRGRTNCRAENRGEDGCVDRGKGRAQSSYRSLLLSPRTYQEAPRGYIARNLPTLNRTSQEPHLTLPSLRRGQPCLSTRCMIITRFKHLPFTFHIPP